MGQYKDSSQTRIVGGSGKKKRLFDRRDKDWKKTKKINTKVKDRQAGEKDR